MAKNEPFLTRREIPEQALICGCGEVFIFMNRRRDQVKMLVWDRSGFVIYYKRLEQGRFELPRPQERVRGQALAWSDLVLILEGISLSSVRRRRRFELPAR